ncbi:hypothetical protein AB0E78_34790 [Streptomyces sp. NPDC032198]|uniref:hypothetical protein n=1 Tax=Streptomyces sp. NPDC032198 TaxID=3155127 RepID=UPI00340093B1
MAASLLVVGKFTDRTSPRLLVISGLALTTIGALVCTQLGADTNVVLLGAALLVSGGGIGLVMVPAMAGAIRDMPGSVIPRASTANRIIMQIGSSFGAAVLILVAQTRMDHLIETKQITPDSLAGAYGTTFWWVIGFVVVSVLLALLLPARKPSQQQQTAGEASAIPSL